MKTLDKLMMTIVGLLCFCVSAAALIFMDFSTEHGVVYADALYCIPVCVLLLAFAVLTILKFRTGSAPINPISASPEIIAVSTLSAPNPVISVRSMPSSAKYPSSIATYCGA